MKKILQLVVLLSIAFMASGCSIINNIFEPKIDTDTLNYISTVVLNSNLKIKTTTYIKAFNTEIPGPLQGTGSGVIIKNIDDRYYLLTNYHVVVLSDSYNHRYTVEDIYNNVSSAVLLANDPDYDLAILRFESTEEMEVMPLATADPKVGELVFSIGSPSGKHNIITAGEILAYQSIDFVDYEVIIHDAVIHHGSSGSMLINDKYEIVGLNTWGFDDEEEINDYVMGGATPVTKILEFLEENGFISD
ncbi:MAG: serine protease [Bacilli bacterium]|jgi:S1-C subfamily serine protease